MNDNNILGETRKSIYDSGLAARMNQEAEKESRHRDVKPKTVNTMNNSASYYELRPKAINYANGFCELREYLRDNTNVHPIFENLPDAGLYRSLTFKENILARVTMFNTDHNLDGSKRTYENRTALFNTYIDSITGIAFQKDNNTTFKIIPAPLELSVGVGFNLEYQSIDYSKIQDGIEVNQSIGRYNTDLTKAEALKHPAWLAALDGDKNLLESYVDIVFSVLKNKYERNTAMGFYLDNSGNVDRMYPLVVQRLHNYRSSVGVKNMNNSVQFLSQMQKPSIGGSQ